MCRPAMEGEEEEEEVFITSGNWRGKDNSLSRYGGADQSRLVVQGHEAGG